MPQIERERHVLAAGIREEPMALHGSTQPVYRLLADTEERVHSKECAKRWAWSTLQCVAPSVVFRYVTACGAYCVHVMVLL
jgi:hypothetical protein